MDSPIVRMVLLGAALALVAALVFFGMRTFGTAQGEARTQTGFGTMTEQACTALGGTWTDPTTAAMATRPTTDIFYNTNCS